jgi:hypothetical protein
LPNITQWAGNGNNLKNPVKAEGVKEQAVAVLFTLENHVSIYNLKLSYCLATANIRSDKFVPTFELPEQERAVQFSQMGIDIDSLFLSLHYDK